MVKRLASPVNAEADEFDPPSPPVYVNLLGLSPQAASLLAAAVCGLVGLGFLFFLLLQWRRRRVRVEEVRTRNMQVQAASQIIAQPATPGPGPTTAWWRERRTPGSYALSSAFAEDGH